MLVLGVIPARLGSTRLPRKPLQLLGGEPLIVRVLARALAIGVADEVVVATDSPEIKAVVEQTGGSAVITSSVHESGTERVGEVVSRAEYARFDIVLNIQGDEPFLPKAAAVGAVDRVIQGADVGTAAAPLDPALADDPARVKVVMDRSGRALYFSRACIPFRRDRAVPAGSSLWQHLGVYAYRRDALRRWVTSPPSELEQIERLEQLRALEIGLRIDVARLDGAAAPGIDTAEDLARAEETWQAFATGEELR